MGTRQPAEPSFQVTHGAEPSDSLVAGFSSFGLAGLTAVDYLTEQLELTETGHITTEGLPAITPFDSGTPRHHTRLFAHAKSEITVLVNELFVPPWAADQFAGSVLDWAAESGVQEITILAGIPLPHGPDEHRTYYIATEDYQETRLAETDLPAMGHGFLDGVNASLVGRGIDSDLRVGILVTPVHAQIPDAEAALRLLDATTDIYALDVDTTELEAFAQEVEQYYQELASRLEATDQDHTFEDRMFM